MGTRLILRSTWRMPWSSRRVLRMQLRVKTRCEDIWRNFSGIGIASWCLDPHKRRKICRGWMNLTTPCWDLNLSIRSHQSETKYCLWLDLKKSMIKLWMGRHWLVFARGICRILTVEKLLLFRVHGFMCVEVRGLRLLRRLLLFLRIRFRKCWKILLI